LRASGGNVGGDGDGEGDIGGSDVLDGASDAVPGADGVGAGRAGAPVHAAATAAVRETARIRRRTPATLAAANRRYQRVVQPVENLERRIRERDGRDVRTQPKRPEM
jgi:hypothetical protein